MKDAVKFVRNVKAVCMIKGLSMEEIEDSIGVCRGYLSRIYRGVIRKLDISKAYLLAEKVGCPMEYLSDSDIYYTWRIDLLNKRVAGLREKLEAALEEISLIEKEMEEDKT